MKAASEQLWIQSAAWTASFAGLADETAAQGLASADAESLKAATAQWSSPELSRAATLASLATARLALRLLKEPEHFDERESERFSRIGAVVIASLIVATPLSIRAVVARSFAPEALRAATQMTGRAIACDPIALQLLTQQIASIEQQPPKSSTIGELVWACFGGSRTDPNSGTVDVPVISASCHRLLRSLRARGVDYRKALRAFEAEVVK